ncbi:aminoacyl-tRNA hydrolase [Candidatus Marsarchaeota G2 archaeon ECH_B_SAG-G16]|jgi:peptidyl-tRNA hydrolase (EC 3.1.1.29)|uniref:Peptidyl-tRNA hydrolase n=5 Tax=Candidatus Marsarchaeota TaxID=1978152 RepID=A0A2R6AHX6_9ARCH|nr:MAG: aminoacyl-tRNA hydrolase [Candidatus Marsarchaeota G1 archaeon OSP_D]PSN85977.1 MAG: aminoacyl-tRNA hydrolase [Candidatus Marsarchaeota G1 archaeon BE_D]PSN88442.1 MAG: aminoacyl-tRNA hydrolase [Candidatus Marsarchaeota G1 archaeon OSP_C]PSN88752.1 MAG: aminoacyl-tRNA hydrolase [Candidatus Marsarchaeota G1 archaeon OSP_B]PSO05796.1 MAG: aminoacyl-tRNA hydrolase [Candidatus Marsarchaeota G2 archaeon ECH_B_SAG-G16]
MDTDYKQVIVVRKDLKLGCGKIAAQVAHASLGSYLECLKLKPEWVTRWKEKGWKKVVTRVLSESEIPPLIEQSKKLNVPFFIVYDAGLTQIPPNTLTCVGFGPAPSDIIDKITGHLKLL